jgi:general secretion pathway protein L
VDRESSARRDLIARRDWGEPLRLLDAATQAFPAPQWIDRLEWNGRTLRLAGLRDPRFDVLTAVEAQRALGVPRTLSSGQSATDANKAPFDLISEPVRGRP